MMMRMKRRRRPAAAGDLQDVTLNVAHVRFLEGMRDADGSAWTLLTFENGTHVEVQGCLEDVICAINNALGQLT